MQGEIASHEVFWRRDWLVKSERKDRQRYLQKHLQSPACCRRPWWTASRRRREKPRGGGAKRWISSYISHKEIWSLSVYINSKRIRLLLKLIMQKRYGVWGGSWYGHSAQTQCVYACTATTHDRTMGDGNGRWEKRKMCRKKKLKRGKGKGENGSENRMKRPEKIILKVGGGEW